MLGNAGLCWGYVGVCFEMLGYVGVNCGMFGYIGGRVSKNCRHADACLRKLFLNLRKVWFFLLQKGKKTLV